MIYSFDIFDTCFVRSCGEPKNVFDILARKVLGEDVNDSFLYDFALIRIKAEETVRKESQYEDITLSEIYEACDFTGLTDMSNEEIMNLEIATEKEQLTPVWELKEKINNLHIKGNDVIYISDMYLSQDFLLQLLKENNFWAEGDKLYVSSQIRKTKQSGTLYQHIANENQIRFKDWHHYGDNRHSDYKIPRRLGIKACLIKHDYTFYEKKLKNIFCSPSSNVSILMASICRSIRLGMKGQSIQSEFAIEFIAPLYVSFVYNILKQAQIDRVKNLYFMARDGYVLYIIAKEFKDSFEDINLHYFYASRKALYPDKDSSVCFEKEASIIKYLVQEGIASKEGNSKVGIVDLRGTRKCHKVINDILHKYNYNPTVGYYLEVLDDRVTIKEAGNYYALWHSERYCQNTVLNEAANLLEQYFSITNQSRTIGYREKEGKIAPVFDNGKNIEANSVLQNLHIEIVKKWIKYYKQNYLMKENEEVLHLSESLLNAFIFNPRIEYLKMLNNFKVSDSGNDEVPYIRNFLLYFLGNLFGKKYDMPNWTWGSLSLTLGKMGYYILPVLRKNKAKLKCLFR